MYSHFDGIYRQLALSTALVSFTAANVYAQDSASGATSEEATLEEIVITAEHREADLQKTAIAISTIDGDRLRTQGKTDLTDALRLVPGVAVRDEISVEPTVVIRGIAPAFGTDPTVNISNDGVYQTYPGSSPAFDLKNMEILKGPQGTLSGRNATGGVVNVITNAPQGSFGGAATLQLGNYNNVRFEGAVDTPINDAIWLRSAVLYSKRDGYLSNGNQDQNIYAVREKINFRPTDNLSILLTGEFDHFGGHGQGVVAAPLSSHDNDPWYSANGANAQDTKKSSGNVAVTWNLGWSTLFFQSGYEDYRPYTDQNMETPTTAYSSGKAQNTTATDELRLNSSADSKLIWQAGLFYLRTASIQLPFAPPLKKDVTHAVTANESLSNKESKAVFGQVTYPIVDAFRVTGGLRYTKDEAVLVSRVFDATTQALNPALSGSSPTRGYSALTYKAGVEFDVAPQSMLYADVSKGYKAGGINTPGSTPTDYQPEYNLAYELGSKNRFLDDTVQLNVDAYYYNYTDMQLVAVGPATQYTAPFPSTPVQNAGKATIYGIEAEAQWLITPNDRLAATAAYNHARFKEFSFYSLNVAVGPTGPVFTTVITDLSDTSIPNAPQSTETLSYEHTFDFTNGGKLSATGDVFFASGHNVEVNPFAVDRYQDSYHLINARLLYTLPDDNWTVGAYGNNLGNVAVRSRAFHPNSDTNNLYLDAPRTYGVNVGVKF